MVVVEDDAILAELLRHALETAGYRCRVLADGDEALDRLAGAGPRITARVVLLDIDLPGHNGIEVLRGLREAGVLDHTSVVVMSGRTSELDPLHILAKGAADHVAKPFGVPLLMRTLQRLLSS